MPTPVINHNVFLPGTGAWIGTERAGQSGSGQAQAVNVISAKPFVSAVTFTTDMAQTSITSGSSGALRFVIFDSDADDEPTTHLATSDEVSVTGSGRIMAPLAFTFLAYKRYWIGTWNTGIVSVNIRVISDDNPALYVTAITASPGRSSTIRRTVVPPPPPSNWVFNPSTDPQNNSVLQPFIQFRQA